MTLRPVIFSGPMVAGLLAGRKTQTRRLATSPLARCQPSDRLYVREAFCWWTDPPELEGEAWPPAGCVRAPDSADGAVDPDRMFVAHREGWDGPAPSGGWRPSIHMPRWAARVVLRVTEVRHQRLREITPADADAEGVRQLWTGSCRPGFGDLWAALHDKPGTRWEDDPDVVALTFAVRAPNERDRL